MTVSTGNSSCLHRLQLGASLPFARRGILGFDAMGEGVKERRDREGLRGDGLLATTRGIISAREKNAGKKIC